MVTEDIHWATFAYTGLFGYCKFGLYLKIHGSFSRKNVNLSTDVSYTSPFLWRVYLQLYDYHWILAYVSDLQILWSFLLRTSWKTRISLNNTQVIQNSHITVECWKSNNISEYAAIDRLMFVSRKIMFKYSCESMAELLLFLSKFVIEVLLQFIERSQNWCFRTNSKVISLWVMIVNKLWFFIRNTYLLFACHPGCKSICPVQNFVIKI